MTEKHRCLKFSAVHVRKQEEKQGFIEEGETRREDGKKV